MEVKLYGDVRKNIATEIIDFQDKSFGLILEKIIEPLVNDVHIGKIKKLSELNKRTEYKDLSAAIKNRLGIKVEVKAVNFTPAAASTAKLGNFSIADYKNYRGSKSAEKYLKVMEKHNNSSIVDTKKAYIKGAFSELQNTLYLNIITLVGRFKLSTKEVVGVMLHELGHIFTYYEYSSKLSELNTVLDDAFKYKSNKDLKEPSVILYNKIKKLDINIEKEIADDIINGNEAVSVLAITKVFSSVNNKTFKASYGDKESERLADVFSNRFGYGRYLVTGLSKLINNDLYKNFLLLERALELRVMVLDLLAIITVILNPSIMFGPLYGLVIVIVFSMYINYVFLNGSDRSSGNYDKITTRYKKVRNDVVRNLKDSSLPVDEIKYLLDSIKEIDEAILNDKIGNLEGSLFTKVSDFIFPNSKHAAKSYERQELLEELQANDLFVLSAQFKTTD